MSSTIRSGRNASASSTPSSPSWAVRVSLPMTVEQHGEARRPVPVVVHDQDAPPGPGGHVAVPEPCFSGTAPPWATGNRTTNVLPRPTPSLRASTVPPCARSTP